MMTTTGKRHQADDRLAGVLDHFYEVSLPDQAAPSMHHLAPNLEMMLVFSFGTPVSFSFGEGKMATHLINRIGLLGPLRRMLNYRLMAGADVLILAFTHNGLYRLLSLPIDSLSQGMLPEREVLRQTQRFDQLWETLSFVSDTQERINILTTYLVNELAENEPGVLPLLAGEPYFHTPFLSPVKTIAADSLLTERTVQLRFKKYVGYSPKELIRFLRFKQVLSAILKQPAAKVDWLELMHRYGYHDQSHLIKDFKYYTGVSPKQFLKLNADGTFCVNRE